MTQWLFYCIASDNKSNDNTAIMTLGKTEENFILENSIKNQSILYLYTVAHTHTHIHMHTHAYAYVHIRTAMCIHNLNVQMSLHSLVILMIL